MPTPVHLRTDILDQLPQEHTVTTTPATNAPTATVLTNHDTVCLHLTAAAAEQLGTTLVRVGVITDHTMPRANAAAATAVLTDTFDTDAWEPIAVNLIAAASRARLNLTGTPAMTAAAAANR